MGNGIVDTICEMDVFEKNTIIWRPVVHHQDSAEPEPFEFDRSQRGSFMARVALNGSFIYEPEIRARRGVVIFIDHEGPTPPPDWTHILVTGKSKSTLFGRFMAGNQHEYYDFRLQVRKQLGGVKDPDLLAQVSESIKFPSSGEGRRTLVIVDGRDRFRYRRLSA